MMLAYTSHKGLERTEKGEVQGGAKYFILFFVLALFHT